MEGCALECLTAATNASAATNATNSNRDNVDGVTGPPSTTPPPSSSTNATTTNATTTATTSANTTYAPNMNTFNAPHTAPSTAAPFTRPGSVLRVCGSSGSGKTELLLQTAATIVLSRKWGGYEGKIKINIYIGGG